MKHFNVFFRSFILGAIAVIFSLSSVQAQHWTVNGQSNYDTWSIYLDNVTIDGGAPAVDDELAIYSGATLVGVYYFDATEDFTGDYQTDYEMVAFTHLDGGAGYTAGDVVTFKYYDDSESEETTGSFTESVLLDNPSDPDEYLDDSDGTLEFPSGDEPYSFVELAFTSGYSISGNVSFAGGTNCFSDLTDVVITATETDDDNSTFTTSPNAVGNYSITGLPVADDDYDVTVSLTNFDGDNTYDSGNGGTAVSLTAAGTQNATGIDMTLTAHVGDIDFTLNDANTSTEITEATVRLHYAADSTFIEEITSGGFDFTDLCVGDYFIAVAKSGYTSDTTSSITVTDGGTTSTTFEISRTAGTIVLNIDNATTGDDVLGATVTSGDSTATEASGVYTLTLPWGTHDVDIEADDYQFLTVEDIELTAGGTVNRDVDLAPFHFQFDGGNSFAPLWTIYITSAQIDGVDLEVNDEIAIYDDGDTLVGTYFVSADFSTTDPTDRVLKAYSELANGDEGYTGDDEYSIVVYDFSAGTEIIPNSYTINQDANGDGTDGDDGSAYDADDGTFPSTALVGPYSYLNLTYTPDEQITFNLETGYQMISSYVEVSDDIEEAFDPVLDNLELVKNEDGNSFREIGASWANNIGAWGIEEGYLVKMTADDDLVVTGQPTLSDETVTLDVGFNIISYLESSSYDTESVFTDGIITDIGNVDFVRDSDGNHYWMIDGSWVNNIGDMNPGEGYFVKMNTADVLDYTAVTPAKSSQTGEQAEPQFFTFEGGNATDKVYTLYIESETLEAGDEVAAYNDGVMVGSTVISDPKDAYRNNLSIFETVNSGAGFEAGNEMELKIWSPRTNDVYTRPYYEFVDKGNAYNKSEYPAEDAQYSHIKLTVEALSLEENELMANVKVYPNPSDNQMMVASPENIDQVRVINTVGQTIYLKNVNEREHTINVSDFESGVYILETTIEGYTKTTRIVVR